MRAAGTNASPVKVLREETDVRAVPNLPQQNLKTAVVVDAMYDVRRWFFHKDETFGAAAKRLPTGTYSIHFCYDRYTNLSLKYLQQQHNICPVATTKTIWDQWALHSPWTAIVLLSISQQGRYSQLPVWNKMRRGAARADPRVDSIVCWRWLQGRNDECRPYSLQHVTYRCRCLGTNTARHIPESHIAFPIEPSTVFIMNMSNELSFTQMTHKLSLCTCMYYASTLLRDLSELWVRTARDRYLSANYPWGCGCTWSRNQPRTAVHP